MEERRKPADERTAPEHDPLLDGAEVPEETPTEDVVPDDLGSTERPPTGTDPEPPLP